MKNLLGKVYWQLLFLIIVGSTQAIGQTSTPKRIALVIGAQNYASLPSLHNSLNDARAITTTLKQKGFIVQSIYDPKTSKEIKDGIQWYYEQIRGQIGAVGMIYYAGHGMQYKGDNYLVPTTIALRNPGDLEDCIKMNRILSVLDETSNALHMLVLDACRTIPSFTRDTEQGLSKMSPPEGSIIVFATKAGRVASDGSGSNGLFTAKLLKVMNEPGLRVNDVFKKVQQEVYVDSKKEQLPELDDLAIGGDFYFTPGRQQADQGNQIVLQPTVKSEPTHEAPKTASLDYGYSLSDAGLVTIGSQTCIVKNLNIDHFANGDPIPEARTDEEWKRASDNRAPAWCYYNNDPVNGRMHGKLYNWYAVNDPRGIAPNGWHVASDGEWDILVGHLAGKSTILNKPVTSDNFTYYSTEGAGTLLKSTFGWENNGNGTNSSGFAGFPGGFRGTNGVFTSIGKYGYWWSSSEVTTDKAWGRGLLYDGSNVGRSDARKGCGFSVRYVRD
jgi:uncharacterized protein (TIGR02145 family)